MKPGAPLRARTAKKRVVLRATTNPHHTVIVRSDATGAMQRNMQELRAFQRRFIKRALARGGVRTSP